MENQNPEEVAKPEEKEIKTNKAYKFIVGFVIVVALLIFIVSTIVLLVKIVPDLTSLVAGTFRAIGQDQPVENMDGTQTDGTALFSVDDSSINSGETITLSWEQVETNGTYTLIFLCDEQSGVAIEHGENFVECGDYLDFDQSETQAQISVILDFKLNSSN